MDITPNEDTTVFSYSRIAFKPRDSARFSTLKYPRINWFEVYQNKYWISTTDGLKVFDRSPDKYGEAVESFLTGVPFSKVLTIGGTLFAFSSKESVYLNSTDGRLMSLPKIPNAYISKTIQFGDSVIYKNKLGFGILYQKRVGSGAPEIMNIDISEEIGIKKFAVNEIAISGDQLLVATSTSLVKIPLLFLDVPERKFGKLKVKEFRVNGNLITETENQNIYADDQIEVKIAFNSFKMGTILDLKYQLGPIDTNYQTSKDNTLRFYNLKVGDYELKLRYGENTSSIRFSVKNHFYESVWFYISLTICVVILLFILFTVYFKRKAFEKQLEFDKNNLRVKALTAQLKPHFIFNSLASIQAYILKNNKIQSSEFLAMFAQYMRSVLNQSEQDLISLDESFSSSQNFLQMEQLRLRNDFEFEINIEPNVDVSNVFVPPLLMQPYIENAIVHAMAKRKTGGLIKINASNLTNGRVLVEIIDNGPGENNADDNQLISNNKASRINSERIDSINKMFKMAFEVEVNVDQSESGFTVKIIIPIHNETTN